MGDEPLSFEAMVTADNAANPLPNDPTPATPPAEPPPVAPPADPTPTPSVPDDSDPSPVAPTDPGPVTPSPADGDPPPTPSPGADDGDPPVVDPILAKAREQYGDQGWIKKYKDGDALLKGMAEGQKLLGQRSEAQAAIDFLNEQGVNQADIERIIKEKTSPAATPTPEPTPPTGEFRQDMVVADREGNIYPAAGAPDNWQELYRAHVIKQQLSGTNTDGIADQVVAKLTPQIEQRLSETKASFDQRLADDANRRSHVAWVDQNKGFLFNPDGSDSPVSETATEYFYKLDPALSQQERLDTALTLAKAKHGVKVTEPVVSPKAIARATPAASPPVVMTDEEFFKKYPSATLMQYMEHAQPDK